MILLFLNDACNHAEKIINELCQANDLKKPRTYRKQARKRSLSIAKSKKRTQKVTRKVIRKQLGYVARNVCYIKKMLDDGIVLNEKQTSELETIQLILD